jgi:SAM-dependent methyltransferase
MDVFSNQNFWKEYGTTPDYQERFEKIFEYISKEAHSLIDVGCGDCSVIRNLYNRMPELFLVGMDTFQQSTNDGVYYCQARLPLLPFPEKSFDVVISLEVLEHIEDIKKSINEIQRLARKQIIIGVPYLENLQTLSTVCNVCKKTSHAYGHLHSFAKNDMVDLLPDFEMEKWSLVGTIQRRVSCTGIFLEHNLAGSFYHANQFICPFCGSKQSAERREKPAIYPIVHGLNRILTMFSPPIPYWFLASYIRKP